VVDPEWQPNPIPAAAYKTITKQRFYHRRSKPKFSEKDPIETRKITHQEEVEARARVVVDKALAGVNEFIHPSHTHKANNPWFNNRSLNTKGRSTIMQTDANGNKLGTPTWFGPKPKKRKSWLPFDVPLPTPTGLQPAAPYGYVPVPVIP